MTIKELTLILDEMELIEISAYDKNYMSHVLFAGSVNEMSHDIYMKLASKVVSTVYVGRKWDDCGFLTHACIEIILEADDEVCKMFEQ